VVGVAGRKLTVIPLNSMINRWFAVRRRAVVALGIVLHCSD
jgi:hypothetical protein